MTPPKTLTVKVTQKHIDEGESAHSDSCPIALAFADKGIRVLVCREHVYSLTHGGAYFGASADASEFVRSFDRDRAVSPATFRFRRIEQ